MTTKFPQGLTDRVRTTFAGDCLPFLDPTRTIQFLDDFNNYRADEWTLTNISGGNSVSVDETERDGVLDILIAAAGATPATVQNPALPFQVDRDFWMETRFKVDSVAQTETYVGISDVDASIRLRDTVSFLKETDGELKIITDNGTTEVETPTGIIMVDDTYIRAGLHYYGGAFIDVYADDVRVVEGLNIGLSQPGPTSNLGPTFSMIRSDANNRTLSIDYFNVYMARAL